MHCSRTRASFREAGSIDARARKKIAELTKEKPFLASAIVGASS